MLFMPVSLMTGYFSIQFIGTGFTVKSYWVAFGVILGLSLILLFAFSFVSGTMEGRMIYRPLTQIAYDFSKRLLLRRKRKEY
jgi:hypothetical protein